MLAGLARAKQAQFYEKGQDFGFAVTSTAADDGTHILMQLSAPTRYGWAAAGTGSRMDNSLMFILYPSGANDGNGSFSSMVHQYVRTRLTGFDRCDIERENRKVYSPSKIR